MVNSILAAYRYNSFRLDLPTQTRTPAIEMLSIARALGRPYLYGDANPLIYVDHLGLMTCVGNWRNEGWQRRFSIWNLFGSFRCTCFFNCIPCNGAIIWNGRLDDLPSTEGVVIHAGKGDPEAGDDCLCPFPGPQTGCECPEPAPARPGAPASDPGG